MRIPQYRGGRGRRDVPVVHGGTESAKSAVVGWSLSVDRECAGERAEHSMHGEGTFPATISLKYHVRHVWVQEV
jgi:hypothetical protein